MISGSMVTTMVVVKAILVVVQVTHSKIVIVVEVIHSKMVIVVELIHSKMVSVKVIHSKIVIVVKVIHGCQSGTCMACYFLFPTFLVRILVELSSYIGKFDQQQHRTKKNFSRRYRVTPTR